MATYTILYNAVVSGTASTGSPGDVLIPSTVDGLYVKATTANRGSRRATGLALTSYVAGGTVDIVQYGEVLTSLTGFAAAAASWVRCSATGTLEKVTPGSGDDLLGKVDTDGRLFLDPGKWDSSNYAGGGGGGGATLPIDLTTGVTGTLPLGNGGTGLSSGLTFPATPATLVARDSVDTLTGKTIAGASNTLSVRIANDVTGLGTNVATLLGTFSGANLGSALTSALAANKVVQATGTGIPHVVSGVLQAASSLIVDADVSASAAVAVSKLAAGTNTYVLTTTGGVPVWAAPGGGSPGGLIGEIQINNGAGGFNGATAVLAGSGYISIGATSASAGAIRTPTAGAAWRFRDSTNAIDLYVVQAIADALYIGCDSTFSANQPSAVNMYALTGGAVGIGLGGTTYRYFYSGNIESWKPATGSAIGSSPWGAVDGQALVTVAASNITLTAAQYCMRGQKFSGTPAGTRTITYPLPAADNECYEKILWAAQTVSGLTITNGGGTTVALTASNAPVTLWFTQTGVIKLT